MGALHRISDFFEHILLSLSVCAAAFARAIATESHGILDRPGANERDTNEPRSRVQYGGQLHDEYELAVLLARHHDELPGSNGRPHRAELCFCRRGNCGGRCVDAGTCAAYDQDDWEFLGRCDALHGLHPAADFNCRCAVLRVAGIDSKLQAGCDRADAGRRLSNDRTGTPRIAALHQDAGH